MNTKKILSYFSMTAVVAVAQLGHSVTFEELTGSYNVFVEGDTNLGGVRVHGTLATGNNLNIYGNDWVTTFNDDNVTGSDYQVVAGNHINLQANSRILGDSKQIRVGTVEIPTGPGTSVTQTVSGNRLNQGSKFMEIDNGQSVASITSYNGIDFDASFVALKALSETFKAMAPTVFPPIGGDLLLDFTAAAGVQVINLNASDINAFGQIKELGGSSLVSGVKYIINVDLTGFVGSLATPNHNLAHDLVDNVIWNFFGADSLEMGKGWRGSILAVDIELSETSSSDMWGTIVAESFTKQAGQIHPGSFDYDIPNKKVPDTGATMMLMLFGGLPLFLLARRRRS